MSNLNASEERLRQSWRALQQQWRSTCDLWNDPVRHRFEREFWQEWEQVVPATLDTMQQLANIASQARRAVR